MLNFAPAVISVPDEISLRKVDLAVELQILSFYQRQRLGETESAVAAFSEGAGSEAGKARP